MPSKSLDEKDIKAITKALRAKNRAQIKLNLLVCDLEDKYDFSCEAGDNIDLAKGVISYARTDNPVESVDS